MRDETSPNPSLIQTPGPKVRFAGRQPSRTEVLGFPVGVVRVVLFLILAYAAFLRLYKFDSLPPVLERDEAMNGCNALQVLETHDVKVFYPENTGREGLYMNMAVVPIWLFGNSAWALRLPAALFGLITVWGVYLLGAELFSTPAGLLSALFIATSFWHIMLSRLALRTLLAPCFLVFAVYFLLRAISRLRDGKRYFGMAILAGAVYGLGFYTYIAYRITPLLLLAILGVYVPRARREGWFGSYLKAAAVFVGVAAALLVPLALVFLRTPSFNDRISQVSVLNSHHPFVLVTKNLLKTVGMFFVRGAEDLRGNVPGRPHLFWPVASLLLMGAVMGGYEIYRCVKYRMWRPDAFPYAILFSWMAIAAIPVILTNEGVPHTLRSSLLIPPAFLLAGPAAVRSYTFLVSRRLPFAWILGGLVLFFSVVCYEPYHTYFRVWAVNPRLTALADLDRISKLVNSLPRKEPKYIVATRIGPAENGVPRTLVTLAFLTRSYTQQEQQETNIHYIGNKSGIPKLFCEQTKSSLPGQIVLCPR
jgi:4-amino-4-deoxy-L-arabinose transferase-like glycosyltransferase